jgi:hypothetical protein
VAVISWLRVIARRGHRLVWETLPPAPQCARVISGRQKDSQLAMTNARKSREAAQEKAAALRKAQAAKDKRRRLLLIGGAGVLILAIVGGVFVLVQNETGTPDSTVSLDAVKTFPNLTSNHVQGTVKYAQTPPVGGDHAGVWLNCGIYTEPVPSENAVHDMEHGAVWITYQPELPAADIKKLTDEVKGQTYITMSPFPGLPAPVVASAWGKQLTLTGASDPRLEAFIKEYKQGPQTPEPGASCTGGIGEPNG